MGTHPATKSLPSPTRRSCTTATKTAPLAGTKPANRRWLGMRGLSRSAGTSWENSMPEAYCQLCDATIFEPGPDKYTARCDHELWALIKHLSDDHGWVMRDVNLPP